MPNLTRNSFTVALNCDRTNYSATQKPHNVTRFEVLTEVLMKTKDHSTFVSRVKQPNMKDCLALKKKTPSPLKCQEHIHPTKQYLIPGDLSLCIILITRW